MTRPALFGGIMLGAAAWLEVWVIFFLTPLTWHIAVIPALFLVAGLFLAGSITEESHIAELAIGGILIAVAVGFVVWFWFVHALMVAALISLGAGILILIGLVFIMGGAGKGY